MKSLRFYTSFFTLILLISLFLRAELLHAQSPALFRRIDSLMAAKSAKPFNGILLIAKGNKILYQNKFGFSDLDRKTPLRFDDQFVIGSVSKQITATLVLREFDQGRLDLHQPIRAYLPELRQSWADTVTTHQLLTHTHGIVGLNQPLAFPAGSRYAYSQLGYQLLGDIAARLSGKPFSTLSAELFALCHLKNTVHPDLKQYKKLVKAYTEDRNGQLILEKNSLENYVAAGAFISTASDLLTWNNCLHRGKLLKPETYQLMTKMYSTRQHPIFGPTHYGYGPTISHEAGLFRLGQTGFAPGFVSMNYYYPTSGTSVIMLENTAWNPDQLTDTFAYHIQVLTLLKEDLLTH